MSTTQRIRQVRLAAPGTPCGFRHGGSSCKGNQDHTGPALAVHVLLTGLPVGEAGTALCPFHSPYDVTPAERTALAARTEPTRDELTQLAEARVAAAWFGRSDAPSCATCDGPASGHDHAYHPFTDGNREWGDEEHGYAPNLGELR